MSNVLFEIEAALTHSIATTKIQKSMMYVTAKDGMVVRDILYFHWWRSFNAMASPRGMDRYFAQNKVLSKPGVIIAKKRNKPDPAIARRPTKAVKAGPTVVRSHFMTDSLTPS
jgi:hypothetical protein